MKRLLFRLCLISTTIVGSMSSSGCSTPNQRTPTDKYVEATVAEPYVPESRKISASDVRVTLSELLAFADENSPAIQTARARSGVVDAESAESHLVFPANPVVSFGTGLRTIDGTSGFEFEAAIEQQLEIAGERQLRIDSARDKNQLSRSMVNEVRWSVHVEVHRLFVDILVLREQLVQANRFVGFAQSMRDISSSQVKAGESSPLVLLVADADLAQTSEAVIQTTQALNAYKARLSAVIGWPNTALPELVGTLPPVRKPPELNNLIELMTKNHPSVRTRELSVVAAQSQAKLEQREAWPEPTVGFSYGREAALGTEASPSVWLIHLTIPVPLWRTNQQGKAIANATSVVADRERDANIIKLRARLLELSSSLRAAAERVSVYDSGVVPRLEENLTLLQRAYELGEVDIHQVSQTRERLLTATGQYIAARIAYYETAAELEGLLGTEIWADTEKEQ